MAPAAPVLEIGVVLLLVAVLGRFAAAAGLNPMIAPLAAGWAAAGGGPFPDVLQPPPEVVEAGAGLALVLVLFSLGLGQTRADRAEAVRSAGPGTGLVDAAANFLPGLLAGVVLGWGLRASLLLGGAAWASSPEAVRWALAHLGRAGNRETPAVLSVLTLENLGMCAFLPLAAALARGGRAASVAASLLATAAAVAAAAWIARERGPAIRRSVFGPADDVVLPVVAVALLAAGLAAEAGIPAAAGALLAGAVLSGPVTSREPARAVVSLLRHVSVTAALLFLGLAARVDGPGVVAVAAALALVTSATKLAAGWWAARRLGRPARLRAGAVLVARGEFSVALALIGWETGLEADLVSVTAVYVALTNVVAGVLGRTLGAPARGVTAGRAAAG